MIIRQSTARTILVGPVLDSTGAAKTDEVVGNIKVTKNGTVGAADGSATLTHDHAGKYKLALTANDCDTVGVLEISLNSGTNDMPVRACNVVETAIWDALFADGATGLLPANVTHFGGNAGTFNSGIPTAALDPASVTAVQSGLATSSALTTVGNNVTAILEDTGTTIPTQISGLNNLSSAGVVAALGTGTWATAIPWNASWDAEVQSEVQDAIEANNLDHLLKIAVDTNFAATVHLDSVIGHIADNGTSATFSRTTDSLEAIRDNQASGGGASLIDIISGVQSVSGAIVEAQNSATLSIRIGDTWTQDIESLGDLTGKVVTFAMKKRASDADTAAIVFIREGDGLTRLNGEAATSAWGSIEILDDIAGDIRLKLESSATSQLTSGSYIDAIKLLEEGADRSPRNAGRTVVSAGVIADFT